MKKLFSFAVIFAVFAIGITACQWPATGLQQDKLLVKNVNLINGKDSVVNRGVDVLIANGRIVEIGKRLSVTDAHIVKGDGKYMMPALINTYAIAGLNPETEYVEELNRFHLLEQLKRFQDFGVLNVNAMAAGHSKFPGNTFLDSLKRGYLNGARLLVTGSVFSPLIAGKTPTTGMSAEGVNPQREIHRNLEQMKSMQVSFIRLETAAAIDARQRVIEEAHKLNLRTVAPVFYLKDALRLAQSGTFMLANSIRDQVVDEQLLEEMNRKGIVYVPTLISNAIPSRPLAIAESRNQLFHQTASGSSDPGRYAATSVIMPFSGSAVFNPRHFKTAMINVKKMHDAGVMIGLGTNAAGLGIEKTGSGEHREMQLLVEAGLEPWQAIRIGTWNSARILRIDKDYGTLKAGKVADFILLSKDPFTDIRNTQSIEAIFKAGKKVSNGPMDKSIAI